MKGRGIGKLLFTGCILILSVFLPGCSSSKNNSVTEIEIVQYKPEASNYFKMVEKAFNETIRRIKKVSMEEAAKKASEQGDMAEFGKIIQEQARWQRLYIHWE